MIDDIKKRRAQAQARRSDPRPVVVGDAQHSAYTILKAIAAATSLEEFNRLEPRFSGAHRQFRDCVRIELERSGRLRGDELERAIAELFELWERNPLFHDQAAYPRAYAVGQKILRLNLLRFYLSPAFLARHPR